MQGAKGRTFVAFAACCPKSEILELLLNPKGANTRKIDYSGRSPLMHAMCELRSVITQRVTHRRKTGSKKRREKKCELEFLKKKNAPEDILDGLRANTKKLEDREPIDEKAIEEYVQLRLQGKA